jgi:hypothetical protein
MPTIKLGARPKNFTQTISVPMHEGEEGTVKISYRYRTRTEYGEFIDALVKDAGVAPAAEGEDVAGVMTRAMARARDKNAHYILQIADGWNLDSEFGLAAITQLCDELPGAALAIMNAYTAAITEGRLGN